MASSPNVRPVLSTYCFEDTPTNGGQVRRNPSDYMLNTGLNRTELERERKKALTVTRRPSSYFSEALNDALEPERVPHHRVTGLPIRGADIKALSTRLDNVIYTPTLIDGHLFFINNEDTNLRTARNVASSDTPEDGVTTCYSIPSAATVLNNNSYGFSVPMDTLERLLPPDTMKFLAKGLLNEVRNGQLPLNRQEASSLALLTEGSGPSQSTATAAYFDSDLRLVTAQDASGTWLQGSDTGSDQAVTTARKVPTSPLNTARGHSARLPPYSTPRNMMAVAPMHRAEQHLSPVSTARSNSNASLRTAVWQPGSPAVHTARSARSPLNRSARRDVNSASLRTARQLTRSPSANTARSARSPYARTARQLSASPSPRTARQLHNSSVARTARQASLSPYPRTARQRTSSSSSSIRTARQLTRSPTPRTAVQGSPSIRTARQASHSPLPRTARQLNNSSSTRTGRLLSQSPQPRTARQATDSSSSSLRTARELSRSPYPRTARQLTNSSSLRTGRQLSQSPAARTARPLNTSTTRTGRQLSLSPSARTGVSSSGNAGQRFGRSPMVQTSPSMRTARQRSATPVSTARSVSGVPAGTISVEPRTARAITPMNARSPYPVNSTVTANEPANTPNVVCQTAPVHAQDSLHDVVDPAQLVRTPTSDQRAATAISSEVRTAQQNDN